MRIYTVQFLRKVINKILTIVNMYTWQRCKSMRMTGGRKGTRGGKGTKFEIRIPFTRRVSQLAVTFCLAKIVLKLLPYFTDHSHLSQVMLFFYGTRASWARRNLLSPTKRGKTRRDVATVRRKQEILKLAAIVWACAWLRRKHTTLKSVNGSSGKKLESWKMSSKSITTQRWDQRSAYL